MPTHEDSTGRFLTIDEVAAELNISKSQAYALVRDRELRALKIGRRGSWRIERAVLEDYITAAYAQRERRPKRQATP